MSINFAHLRERSTSGGWINFAVFDARSASGTDPGNGELLPQLEQRVRELGLRAPRLIDLGLIEVSNETASD